MVVRECVDVEGYGDRHVGQVCVCSGVADDE